MSVKKGDQGSASLSDPKLIRSIDPYDMLTRIEDLEIEVIELYQSIDKFKREMERQAGGQL